MSSWRRHRALRIPFADAWREMVGELMPHWRCLDHGDRSRMEDLIRVFLAVKHVEGAGSLSPLEWLRSGRRSAAVVRASGPHGPIDGGEPASERQMPAGSALATAPAR